MITFTVWGVAQPKGSAKAFVPAGWTRAVVTSANPKVKGWQQLIAEAASDALDEVPFGAGAYTTGPVKLTVDFRLPRPKAIGRRTPPHLKKPDLDKLVRSVKDALTKVLWRDDSQVTEIEARKGYVDNNGSPHAVITVEAVR
mgnify:CR=1 FL=1